MPKRENVVDAIIKQRLLPLYFHSDPEVCAEILKALFDAGIRVVEFTNRGEAAIENFIYLKKTSSQTFPGLYLGAGTIKDIVDATEFINAGADFIVSPGIVPDVVKLAHKNGLTCIPGCMSATEIMKAEELGVRLVKLFPGNLLGPGFVKAIKEIFPDLMFMPTGGVELAEQDLQDWFNSGVAAVGMGSKLISKTLVDAKEYSRITEVTKQALQIVSQFQLS